MVKNVQFLYAAIRFATYVHRCKLSSGDFIKWFYRWKDNAKQYPPGIFKEFDDWLFANSNASTQDGNIIYTKLLESKTISEATTAAAVSALEKKEKEGRDANKKQQ